MGDASNLLRQSYQLVQQATLNDRNGNYQEALRLYLTGLEGFVSALKIEKNEKIRGPLKLKMNEYMDRCEQLKMLIANKKGGTIGESCNNGCISTAAGGGGGGLSLPSVPINSPFPPINNNDASLILPSVPTSLPGDKISPIKPSAPFIETPYFPNAPQLPIPPTTSSPTMVKQPNNNKIHMESITIQYGQTNCSYDTLFGRYLVGGTRFIIQDPYIRARHQCDNFVRLCELILKRNQNHQGKPIQIKLITSLESSQHEQEVISNFKSLKESLINHNIFFEYNFSNTIHDRSIDIVNNGITIKLGRGLDIYQKPLTKFCIGNHDLDFKSCLETTIDIFKSQ
ncbi:microtubule interacting and transport domain-containing protein [Cavenderia fasciculata]|uniref:Microtubule interacting and transport domain-containing protein n=1 Tax=Cavenderia fasciculata TaxID=261658 RepID=F4PSM8_CACFS|nr:microtubule interacting and transport domain-containing protein [Cavenderia fasciculata]EGG20720.1 microtubule interacting and transport domain-containing protein [Cavenderia fasciculata]|eukprot:XP_004358570.1 microtubule interacting and transport domain-containing protein [Cavenderia fasciculata]